MEKVVDYFKKFYGMKPYLSIDEQLHGPNVEKESFGLEVLWTSDTFGSDEERLYLDGTVFSFVHDLRNPSWTGLFYHHQVPYEL